MHEYTLTHLSDEVLLRDLAKLVVQDRSNMVRLLAHLAEVDARRLYAAAGYPSMFLFCLKEFRFSEGAAYRRIRAARAAQRFPALFDAMAEGRLHLAGVCLLAPHLTKENLDELVKAATHRLKSEIEEWLTHRFPGARVASKACIPIVRPIHVSVPELSRSFGQLALESASGNDEEDGSAPRTEEVSAPDDDPSVETRRDDTQLIPGSVGGADQVENRAPEAPTKRYLVRFIIDEETHEKLRRAQALLSHAVPDGDMAQVLSRALDSLIVQLEKRKAAVGVVPRGTSSARTVEGTLPQMNGFHTGQASRYIPARIRRAVWERDEGRCTFVGASGHRCETRRFLEFDHVQPVARGGVAKIEGIRLRCRAHNQYEAERVFGADFMEAKRDQARGASEVRVKGDARETRTRAASP